MRSGVLPAETRTFTFCFDGKAGEGKVALNPRELCPLLGLDKMRDREWHVQGTVATQGTGLYEGLDWLARTIKGLHRQGQHTSVGQSKVAARVK